MENYQSCQEARKWHFTWLARRTHNNNSFNVPAVSSNFIKCSTKCIYFLPNVVVTWILEGTSYSQLLECNRWNSNKLASAQIKPSTFCHPSVCNLASVLDFHNLGCIESCCLLFNDSCKVKQQWHFLTLSPSLCSLNQWRTSQFKLHFMETNGNISHKGPVIYICRRSATCCLLPDASYGGSCKYIIC